LKNRASSSTASARIYHDGAYRDRHPEWHKEDSAWKAAHIVRMLARHTIRPRSVCDIGCGAGDVLRHLAPALDPQAELCGYDWSADALAIAQQGGDQRIRFRLGSPFDDARRDYELVMANDVFEHVEDYLGFLERMRGFEGYKIFHIPLDLSCQSVLRVTPILGLRRTGHLHYFTKETALATLTDTGYEIVDWFYTASGIYRPRSLKSQLAQWPRRLLFKLHADLAVRILGGHSMLVLAR